MLRRICRDNECTSCNACENICSHEAVKRIYGDEMSWEMGIDDEYCVDCGLCRKVCPSYQSDMFHGPRKAFAAWSNHEEIRKVSASGGIATELYLWAIKQNMVIVGAEMDKNYEVHLISSSDASVIESFRNSKYTFCFADQIYKRVMSYLRQGIKVLFIGLPCQIAAMQSYVKLHKSIDGNLLITVDLVCHGTPPPEYLKQHVKSVSKGKIAQKVFFRDPRYKTEKYSFSLYEAGDCSSKSAKPYYHKYVLDNDLYQIAFHKAMANRNCCYSCKYAKRERVGDITLGDYSGLGKLAPWRGSTQKVSLVLLNTEKGEDFFKEIYLSGEIIGYERPLMEPISSEQQLNRPSEAPPERAKFLVELRRTGEFDSAASVAFDKIAQKQHLLHIFKIRELKQMVVLLIPKKVRSIIKKIVKK